MDLEGQNIRADFLVKDDAARAEIETLRRGQPPPGAEGVMTRAEHLDAGRGERAESPIRGGARRSHHECRLRLVELARDARQERFGRRAGDDGQRVAAERCLGEHVD
jgi:hypothetical protein